MAPAVTFSLYQIKLLARDRATRNTLDVMRLLGCGVGEDFAQDAFLYWHRKNFRDFLKRRSDLKYMAIISEFYGASVLEHKARLVSLTLQ